MKNKIVKQMLKTIDSTVDKFFKVKNIQRVCEFPGGFKFDGRWDRSCQAGITIRPEVGGKRYLITAPSYEVLLAFVQQYREETTMFDLGWIPDGMPLLGNQIIVHPSPMKGDRFGARLDHRHNLSNQPGYICRKNAMSTRIRKALTTGVPTDFAQNWVAKFEQDHPQENREQSEAMWFALKRAKDLAIAGNHTVADLSSDESDEFSIAIDIIADYWGPLVVRNGCKEQFRDRTWRQVRIQTPSGESVLCWQNQHGENYLFSLDI